MLFAYFLCIHNFIVRHLILLNASKYFFSEVPFNYFEAFVEVVFKRFEVAALEIKFFSEYIWCVGNIITL